ncbi:MAG TPA: hypothetical protein VF520_10910 [Thermoleophilaceae bacterium]
MLSQTAVEGSADDQVEGILLVHEHAGTLLGISVLQALSTALLIVPIGYLYLATRFRRPELPRLLRPLLVVGPLGYAALFVARQLSVNSIADDVVPQLPLPPERAEDLVDDKITQGSFVVISGLTFAAQLAVGAAIVLVSINARRAGLLSGFMGILGAIVGVLFVIPLLGQLPVVQLFWIAALGVLLLDRWPGTRGPAWETGEAIPWPTAADLRAEAAGEEPEAGGGGGRRGAAEEPDEPDPDETEPADEPERAAPAHPSSKKRKRKRRR